LIFDNIISYFDTGNRHSVLEEVYSSQGAIAFYTQFVTCESDFDKLKKGDLVFFFINEDQEKDTFEEFSASFRKELYSLYPGNDWNKKIYDLGNLKQGNKPGDTHALLKEIISHLYTTYEILPLVIGGGDDVDYLLFTELSKHHQALTVVETSAIVPDLTSKDHFLAKIIHNKNESLFQYTQLGYQQYLNNPNQVKRINELYFEAIRLGEVKVDIARMEPKLRNAHYASFRMDVLRTAELVPSEAKRPNGLFSHELCQLIWYTAFSGNLRMGHISSVAYDSVEEIKLAQLAQLFWHFLDGYQSSVKENFKQSEYFLKYTVLKDNNEWIFYKSKRTERWWVEVTKNCENKIKILIPCMLDDYNSSLVGEIPESWFRYLSKIN